jgi:transcriptional regulator NrdR family protein
MLAGKDSLTEANREVITEEIISELRQRGLTVIASEIAQVALGFLAKADWQSWLRYALNVIDVETVHEYVKWVNTNSKITGEHDNKEPRILVRKKNGTIEYFNSTKLARSIQYASQGCLSDQSIITDIVNRTSSQARTVFRNSGNPISTSDVGTWVESSLASLNPLISLSYSILFRSVDSLSSLENIAQRIETLSNDNYINNLEEDLGNYE